MKAIAAAIILTLAAGPSFGREVEYHRFGGDTYRSDGTRIHEFGGNTYVERPDGHTTRCHEFSGRTYCEDE